jgi:NifU-like protein involved in Fe-S cluster formation
MDTTKHYGEMRCIHCCMQHGAAPIPQEGSFAPVTQIDQVSGFSHGVGTCAMKQGACKLTVNCKDGIIQETLIETVGCSGMTQSAAMAAEILPGKTLLEALNTDLVCDAINVAMREQLLNLVYGRSQTAFTDGGLAVGSGLEDLGSGHSSMVGTSYGTAGKGPRYLQMAEGYIRHLALDENDTIIGYQYTDLGGMMELIESGVAPADALEQSTGTYGRYDEATTYIDPRKE